MKATLKFDLSDHSERLDMNCCMKGKEMALVLWEILNNKYNELERDERLSDEYLEGAKEVIEEVQSLMDMYSIVLDDLIE